MPNDPLVPRVVRRYLRDPSDVEAQVEDAVERQVELLDALLACAAEIDWLRHEAHAAIDAAHEPPKAILARVGDCFRRRAADDHELRLRDVAAQARALITRIRRDPEIDMGDVVRGLEAIVETAGVAE